MRLRPNVALQQTGRLLMKRALRALLLIALQLNLGVSWTIQFDRHLGHPLLVSAVRFSTTESARLRGGAKPRWSV